MLPSFQPPAPIVGHAWLRPVLPLLLGLGSLWGLVIDEVRHERALVERAARSMAATSVLMIEVPARELHQSRQSAEAMTNDALTAGHERNLTDLESGGWSQATDSSNILAWVSALLSCLSSIFPGRNALRIVWISSISLLMLAAAAIMIGDCRRYLRHAAALRKAYDYMAHLANSDVLTGISSRRAFFHRLEAELVRTHRFGEHLSVLMLDIDHFKRVNDTFGHQAGDTALKQFAAICAPLLRAHDLFGRLGGEEFAIALPHTDLEGARCVAEKIRVAVAEASISTEAGLFHITTSIGVASANGGRSADQLIAWADGALYEAKQKGRDRVCVSFGRAVAAESVGCRA